MADSDSDRTDEAEPVADVHASDAGADAPADAHGTDGHAAEPLGPVDTQAWIGAIFGGAIAVVLVLAILVAIGGP